MTMSEKIKENKEQQWITESSFSRHCMHISICSDPSTMNDTAVRKAERVYCFAVLLNTLMIMLPCCALMLLMPRLGPG